MVSLEQQFEKILDGIILEDKEINLIDSEIVHSCLVNDDFAKITLILPVDSPLRNELPGKVEAAVKQLDAIKRVAVEVVEEPPPEEDECPLLLSRHRHEQSTQRPQTRSLAESEERRLRSTNGACDKKLNHKAALLG